LNSADSFATMLRIVFGASSLPSSKQEHEVDHVLRCDRIHRSAREERRQMHADLALDVLHSRALAALALDVELVATVDLLDVEPLAEGARDLDLGPLLPQLGLGLGAGEPFAAAGLSRDADLALRTAAIGRPPLSVPRRWPNGRMDEHAAGAVRTAASLGPGPPLRMYGAPRTHWRPVDSASRAGLVALRTVSSQSLSSRKAGYTRRGRLTDV
jgi:hypothetical protein